MSEQLLAKRSRVQAAIDTNTGDERRADAACPRSAAQPHKKRSCKKRRKSRTVERVPVRQLFAHDTTHFREIVQQFTGLSTLNPPIALRPPPPSPPPLAPIRPSSAFADYPLAIAHSLRSTLQKISACLQQILQGAQSEELGMCNRNHLAFLQGLLHPHSESREYASKINSLFCDLASLAFSGDVVNNSSFYDVDSNPLQLVNSCHNGDLKFSFGDGGGVDDPKTFLLMQTHHTPKDTHDNPSNSYRGGNHDSSVPPPPFFGKVTHIEIPKLANDCARMSSSNDCGDIDLQPAIAMETLEIPKLTNDHPSISYGGVEDSLNSLYTSPPHDIFHDNFNIYHPSISCGGVDDSLSLPHDIFHDNLNICHKNTVVEDPAIVENMDSKVKQEGQLLEKVEVRANDLERFLLEEHNEVDFFMSPLFKQNVSQQSLLPPV